MSIVLTQAYLRGLNTGYNVKLQGFLASLAGTPRISAQFMERTNSAGFAQMEYNMAAGIPVLKEITGDAQEISNLSTMQAVLANRPYSRLIGLKREVLERQQASIYERDLNNSAIAYGLFEEQSFFARLMGGFTVGSDPARKTEAFFAANKVVAEGKPTKFTNLGTKKLSAANFELALASLRTRKDADGNYLGFGSDLHLLVSPTYESTADSIVRLDTLVNGGKNPNYGKAKLHICPWLGDNEHNWFLIDTAWVKPAIYQTEVPLASYMQTNPEDSDVMLNNRFLYQLYHRGVCSLSDALCAYGSTGAAAA